MKRLAIKSDGNLVRGGYVEYDAAADGTLKFAVHVTAHYLFSDHEIRSAGTYKVDPKLIQSKTVKVGEKIHLGKTSIEVLALDQKKARAHVDVEGIASGDAVISLARELIEIMSINAAGSFMGFKLKLEAA